MSFHQRAGERESKTARSILSTDDRHGSPPSPSQAADGKGACRERLAAGLIRKCRGIRIRNLCSLEAFARQFEEIRDLTSRAASML